MKKQLSSFLLSLLSMAALADPITPQRAMQIAQDYLVPGNAMTMARRAVAKLPSTQNSPYYVISRGANKGYVIVAGDDCLPEVLGYTESGDFDADNIPDALKDMLDGWQTAVEQAQADGSNVSEAKARKVMRKAATSSRVSIAPFVSAHWHQSSPYNDICPCRTDNGSRAMTGCVATAASQVLYYWRKDLPSTLGATTPTYSYGNAHPSVSFPKGHPVKWDLMLDSYSSESQEFKTAVSEFVYCVGTATWLTYADGTGTATSGNVEKLPYTFSTYFGMNGGDVKYRDSYSQEGWTQLIYDELAKGHPVIYTGTHPTSGGHCVFIHGYNASNDLMYFNFGWGGQSDGYYTTDQTTGMNGFCGGQSALIGAYPKSWNVDVSVTAPSHTYVKVDNSYTVKITNNSTLDINGLYIFSSSSSSRPTDLTKANSCDADICIAKGESATSQLTVKPTTAKTTYIYVTDANLSVLASTVVEAETSDASLSFETVSVSGSSDVTEKDGIAYTNVYNDSKATINMCMNNHSNTAWGGYAKTSIYCLNDETNEWEFLKSVSNSKAEVGAAGKSTVEFAATSLEMGKYYYATCPDEWGMTASKTPVDITEPTVDKAYFTLKGADMEVVSFEDNVLKLKGHFDNTNFNLSAFAKKSTYKTATAYDLTECQGVKTVSQTINPNALYYVADDSEAEGDNIVKAGSCVSLVLTTGYNFVPKADFTAVHASLVLANATPGKWQLVTVPFAAKVADGFFVREDTLFKSSNIKTKDVSELEAGKTYIVMTSSLRNNALSGENVSVLALPKENADASVVGTYTNTTTPSDAMLINDEEKQYFAPVDAGTAVDAFSGYYCNASVTAKFRAYTNLTLDAPYAILAQDIEEAYGILDKYKDIVTSAAYKGYLAEIKDAEHEFTARTIASSAKVKTYYTQLLANGETYMKQIDDAGNAEIDFTDNITNPSFEKNSTAGWTVGKMDGVTTAGGVYDGTKANDYRAVGLDGTYIYQSLVASKDSTSVGIQQEVKNLTPGYYRLTAMVGTDEASTVTVFAGDSMVTVPGHSFGHLYLSKAIINNVRVEAAEGSETGSLLIGVKAGRWYKADNFRLTYVGSYKGEEEEDAITDIVSAPVRTGIFTLQGTRVSNASRPGLYIIDGRKVMVK